MAELTHHTAAGKVGQGLKMAQGLPAHYLGAQGYIPGGLGSHEGVCGKGPETPGGYPPDLRSSIRPRRHSMCTLRYCSLRLWVDALSSCTLEYVIR